MRCTTQTSVGRVTPCRRAARRSTVDCGDRYAEVSEGPGRLSEKQASFLHDARCSPISRSGTLKDWFKLAGALKTVVEARPDVF